MKDAKNIHLLVYLLGYLHGARGESVSTRDYLLGEVDEITSDDQTGDMLTGATLALGSVAALATVRANRLDRASCAMRGVIKSLDIEAPDIDKVVAGLVPNDDVQCAECGRLPTMDVEFSTGVRHRTMLCARCFYGDELHDNPESWRTS